MSIHYIMVSEILKSQCPSVFTMSTHYIMTFENFAGGGDMLIHAIEDHCDFRYAGKSRSLFIAEQVSYEIFFLASPRDLVLVAFNVLSRLHRQQFLKGPLLVTIYSKYARALTFENFGRRTLTSEDLGNLVLNVPSDKQKGTK